MYIFFDTEFTGLHKDTTLISIGLVDEKNRSFYAEFTDYDKNQVDNWIEKNVISNLNYKDKDSNWISKDESNIVCVGSKEYIRKKLEKWLSAYKSIQLVSDCCHYDMVLLIDIFGSAFDLPDNINASCHDINQDIASFYNISEKEAFDKSREDILKDSHKEVSGDKHNSLYDAKVIKEIFKFLNK